MPMLYLVLPFLSGIILLQFMPALPGGRGLFALLVFLFLGYFTIINKNEGVWHWVKRAMLLLFVTILGVSWATWRADWRLTQAFPESLAGKDIAFTGTVDGLVQRTASGIRFNFRPHWPSIEAAEHLPEIVMLSWYQRHHDQQIYSDAQGFDPALRWLPGDNLALTVRLKPAHGSINPHGFDFEAWLLGQNIRATGYVRSGASAGKPDESFPYLIDRWRYLLREQMYRALPEEGYPYRAVMVALAIGDQKAIPQAQWTVFNRTGISHLVSISGLHVTMVAGLMAGLVGFVWRRVPRLSLWLPTQILVLWVGAGGALFYALLAGFAVPAQRTAYMLLVVALAGSLRRYWSARDVLLSALLVVAVLDPWCVLAAGFWLSFLAVAALLWVSASEYGVVKGGYATLKKWGKLQWTATLASIPVLLLIFQQFSLVSPLANALAIPVVSLLVTPLALLGAVLPSGPFLNWAHWLFAVMMQPMEWLAAWPVWFAPAAPWWVAVMGMLGAGFCLLPRGVPLQLMGILLLLPALFWQPDDLPADHARVSVLDVGQGLASVVQTRNHTLIYDPGPVYGSETDAGQRVMLPWLQAMGIQRVDRLIVTHPDSDHAGGLTSVVFGIPVDEVMLSGDISRLPGLVSQLTSCEAGKQWDWDGVRFEILYPAAGNEVLANGKRIQTNHLSCVLKVTAGGARMLLTSDIEAVDEKKLLQHSFSQLSADVMMVPHHGSKTSSTPAFIQAVGAGQVVIPVGYLNRFGHPKPEVLARYQASGATIWRTDRQGAIIVDLSADGAKIKGWRKHQPRYWFPADE